MKSEKRIGVQMEIDQPYKRHVSIFAGIHRYARQQENWRLIVDDWAWRSLPVRKGKPLPYDGIIGRMSAEGIDRANRLNVPVVNVLFKTADHPAAGVFPDFDACGRLRAEHLLARGFRNFGTLFMSEDRALTVEAIAFHDTIESAGFECTSLQLDGNHSALGDGDANYRHWKRGKRRIEKWMEGWNLPIGLFVSEVDITRVLIELCFNRGWRIPEDVAIVAGTNEEELCTHPEPSITSLEYPNEQIGYEAARLLDKTLNASEEADPSTQEKLYLPPVGIVARRSTDFIAVDDELMRRALRYIDEHLEQPISIDDVAEALLISRRKLTSEFRKNFKRTVAGEIQRLRVERVKRELYGTRLTVQEIARRSGFGSLRTLNEAFVRVVGCTPREYRNSTHHFE